MNFIIKENNDLETSNQSIKKQSLSYSMIVDNDFAANNKKPAILKSNNNQYTKHIPVISRNVNTWINDVSVTNCYNCKSEFSTFLRKHHCRACGRIYCYKCSVKREIIPHGYQIIKQDSNQYLRNIQDYLNYGIDIVRICDNCSVRINRFKKIQHLLIIFNLCGLHILDIKRIASVCKLWKECAYYYFELFREIQYYLPNHVFTQLEEQIIWNNRIYFSGHSKLMIQLLKIATISNKTSNTISNTTEVLKIVKTNKKQLNCWQMMCTRNCSRHITSEESLNLIVPFLPINQNMQNMQNMQNTQNNTAIIEIKSFALTCMNSVPQTEFLLYIPFLVHQMRNCRLIKTAEINNPSNLIGEYLINKCKKLIHSQENTSFVQLPVPIDLDRIRNESGNSVESDDSPEAFRNRPLSDTYWNRSTANVNYITILANDIYWELKINSETNDANLKKIYQYYMIILMNELPEIIRNKIKTGVIFTERLSPVINNTNANVKIKSTSGSSTNKYKENITDIIKKLPFENLYLPINPLIKCHGIVADKIQIKDSGTSPIILPIKINETKTESDAKTTETPYKTYDIMYKPEDIRKDQIVMNMIRLIDIILKREENLDLNIVTYNIRPTSSNGGFIEIVPNSHTIYYIKEKLNFSILNYIIEHNKLERIDKLRSKFIKSCAAYCVITYLFGIGDRHLDNIMITRSGLFFHIDFGFILGCDPKPMTIPTMRINSDIINTLGGVNSEYYEEFKKICNNIYNCIRRHIDLFINILSIIPECDPPIENYVPITKEQIMQEILQRFMPGENYVHVGLHMSSIIDQSNNSYKHAIIDFFHHHMKDNSVMNKTSTAINFLTYYLPSTFFKKVHQNTLH
jgi:hypothetical protein